MTLFLIIIGILLIAAAVRDTQGDLFQALKQDVPSFLVWGSALVAIGAIGFVPGLKTPSRVLLALIIVVLVVNNYQKIIAGFGNANKTVQASTSQSGQTK